MSGKNQGGKANGRGKLLEGITDHQGGGTAQAPLSAGEKVIQKPAK